ncbi:MAG: c-type cytochrome [Acidobacteriota bacterium]|nr:c-type cytochrome [Acidobacteriota bacterium]
MKIRPWHGVATALWVAACGWLLVRNYQIEAGRKAFEGLSCPSCHIAGGAPSLEHVGAKYNRATIRDFVSDPDTVYARMGRKPLNSGYEPMPRPKATPHQIEMISHFLAAQE